MEMTMNLPRNYVEIEEEEMMYLDGGGLGKHWYNRVSNVAIGINVISFLIPVATSLYSLRKVGKLATAGRTYIRTNIASALRKARLGFASAFVSSAINCFFLFCGGSVGSWIAGALDMADGRKDNYIFA